MVKITSEKTAIEDIVTIEDAIKFLIGLCSGRLELQHVLEFSLEMLSCYGSDREKRTGFNLNGDYLIVHYSDKFYREWYEKQEKKGWE